MAQKSDLISAIQFTYDQTLSFAGKLSEAERSTPGQADGWAARDVLAHLADSTRQLVETLAAGRRGAELPAGITNEEVYHHYKGQPWENILAEIHQSHQSLFEQIQTLNDEELNIPMEWLNGRAIWRAIAGTAILHPVSHLAQALVERGEPAQAIQLNESVYAVAGRFDDSSDWQRLFPYNTACLYALMGDKHMALQNLKSSFEMSPRMVALSKQDTDLVSLHGDTDFLALLEQFPDPEQASGS